jgi:hypothetical protein
VLRRSPSQAGAPGRRRSDFHRAVKKADLNFDRERCDAALRRSARAGSLEGGIARIRRVSLPQPIAPSRTSPRTHARSKKPLFPTPLRFARSRSYSGHGRAGSAAWRRSRDAGRLARSVRLAEYQPVGVVLPLSTHGGARRRHRARPRASREAAREFIARRARGGRPGGALGADCLAQSDRSLTRRGPPGDGPSARR